MPNNFLTPSVFAQEGLMILENELVLGNKVHADYSDEFAMVGDTISIRRPTAYQGQDNNLNLTGYSEDIVQGKTTITMNRTKSVKVSMAAIDKTLSFDRVVEDVIRPVMVKFKDAIEVDIASNYKDFYWHSGTPGTVPSTFAELGGARAILTDAGVTDDVFAVHGTDASLKLADGLKSVYVSGKAKTAFEEAEIGRYARMMNYESVHAPTHTAGAQGGTPLVNGGAQNVTYAAVKDTMEQTLNTDGWTASVTNVLRAGDVFTIAGVFAVNPVSKQSTGRLQTFVVKSSVNSTAGGAAALTISPPIITSGAYQTVDAAPADNAAITVKTGSANQQTKQSLLLHPKAITLVTRPLNIAQGAGVKTATKTGNRVTISVTEWVNGDTLDHFMRFDMLWSTKTIDARLGGRLNN